MSEARNIYEKFITPKSVDKKLNFEAHDCKLDEWIKTVQLFMDFELMFGIDIGSRFTKHHCFVC